MSDIDIHTPTPEFRDRLEWEVTTAFRRARRLSGTRRARLRPWLRAAAVVFASVALGASAGIASAQIGDSTRRDSLLDAAQAELYLASLRLDLARSQLDDAQRKAQIGVVTASLVASVESELRSMQAAARRVQLNMEEIRAAAQPPRDELNAPPVNGRDFVSERLMLDLYVAQQRLTAAEQARDEAERRVRLGVGGPISQMEAELDVARAHASLATLAERQKLRKEFLEKGTPVDQLLRRQQQAELRYEMLVAQRALDLARGRLTLFEKGQAVGTVEHLDVLKARVEVREREIDLMALNNRLRRLQ